MSPTETHRLLFRDKFRSLHHEGFQSWFEELARALYPDGEFLPVRVANGDGALDGLLANAGEVFQVFAPARIAEMRDGQTAAKIVRDFGRACETVGEAGIRSWTFLHNHPQGRLGPKSVSAVNGLNAEHRSVKLRVLDIDSLWELVKDLPDDKLDKLVGATRTEEIHAGKLDALLKGQSDANDLMDRLLLKLEAEEHVPREALRSILVAFGEADVPDEGIVERLRAKALEYRELIDRLAEHTSAEHRVRSLRMSARDALLRGDFNEAGVKLNEAREILPGGNRFTSEDPILEGAEIIALLAALATLRSDHREAAALYHQAFHAASGDTRKARDYRIGEARAWIHHGEQCGEDSSLSRGLEKYRSLLGEPLEPQLQHQLKSDLASALIALSEIDSSETHLEEAITLLAEILGDGHKPLPADQRFTALNRIAIARTTLGVSRSNPALISVAIKDYDAAIAHVQPGSLEYAMVCNNIGNAYAQMCHITNSWTHARQAISQYERAIDTLRPADEPDLWASINNNLGNARHTAASISGKQTRRERIELLWAAVDGFNKAIQQWTVELWPLKWATVMMNLGNTLHDVAEITEDAQVFQDAIKCYEDALGAAAQESVPLLSARIRFNLASTLNSFGTFIKNPELYAQSERIAKEALERWPPGIMPIDWAATNLTLGAAIGNNDHDDPGRIQESIDVFERALTTFELLNIVDRITTCEIDLIYSYRRLAEHTKSQPDYEKAIGYARRALRGLPQGKDRAQTQFEFSKALFGLGVLARDPARLIESERVLREAIPIFENEGLRNDCAIAYNNISASLRERILFAIQGGAPDKRRLREMARKSIAALRAAAELWEPGSVDRAKADAALALTIGLAHSYGARTESLAEANDLVRAALSTFKSAQDDENVRDCKRILKLIHPNGRDESERPPPARRASDH